MFTRRISIIAVLVVIVAAAFVTASFATHQDKVATGIHASGQWKEIFDRNHFRQPDTIYPYQDFPKVMTREYWLGERYGQMPHKLAQPPVDTTDYYFRHPQK